jgi:hypothetical protein
VSIKIEHQERTVTVITDDANAENAAIADAVELAAPELLGSLNGTPMVDGEMRWEVDQADWGSLEEVLAGAGNESGNPEFDDAANAVGELIEKYGTEV